MAGAASQAIPKTCGALPLVQLERIEAKSLQTRVYQSLKSELIGGTFEPGHVLVIREIAQQLGVSPMPVRQALHRLVSEYALEEEDKARASVRVPELSDQTFEELRAARVLVEGEAVAIAAKRMRPATIGRLNKLNKLLLGAIESSDVAAAINANYRFHFELYETANSTIIMRVIESLWLQSGPYFRVLISKVFSNIGRPDIKLNNNDRLLAALAANNSEAAREALADDINVAAAIYRALR